MQIFKRKKDVNKGVSFGLTSGVITTLGLIVGLETSTQSKEAVIAGILSIAIADSFSDAMGMHVSEESHAKSSATQIWRVTAYTFLSKLLVALSFVVPISLFPLGMGVCLCILWGALVISIYSYKLAKCRGDRGISTVIEHMGVTVLVLSASFLVGKLIKNLRWIY